MNQRVGAVVVADGTEPSGATFIPNRKYNPTENRMTPASSSQRTMRLGGSTSSAEGIGRYSSRGLYIKEWRTIRGL